MIWIIIVELLQISLIAFFCWQRTVWRNESIRRRRMLRRAIAHISGMVNENRAIAKDFGFEPHWYVPTWDELADTSMELG